MGAYGANHAHNLRGALALLSGATSTAASTAAAPVKPPASLLTNGDFSDWTNGRPDDWQVDIGARNGADDPKSEIVQLSDPGLSLRGEASTLAWHNLSQGATQRRPLASGRAGAPAHPGVLRGLAVLFLRLCGQRLRCLALAVLCRAALRESMLVLHGSLES